jgi:hyaluronan synthase
MLDTVGVLSRVQSRSRVKYLGFWKRLIVWGLFTTCITGMVYVNLNAKAEWDFYLGIYGSVMVTYLLLKMMLSFFYRPEVREPLPGLKVSVVVPSYNEKPDAVVKTVESLLEQDYPVHEIIFVDDGSKDTSGYEAIKKLAAEIDVWKEVAATVADTDKRNVWFKPFLEYPEIIVHRYEKNRGKRHAQAYGFRRATGDLIMTVDSDGYIYPDAVRELLKPFYDDEVMAVTGHINARNRDDNWFTKLLDMRYDNAFRVERAAQSVTNTVLVCSGPISMYRREVILDNLDDFENQTFLGEQVQFGDDRRLTNYALLAGKTKYQATARCITDVPSSFRQFLKQQVRWNKSFYRETWEALKIGVKRPRVFIWAMLEMSLWIMFGVSLIFALFYQSWAMGWVMGLYYLGYLSLSAFARNVFYVLKHPLTYLAAPLYGLIHIGLLLPIRLYALITIKENGWGTR